MKHSNPFRNRNFIIIVVLIAVVAAVFILSLVLRPAPSISADSRQIAILPNAENSDGVSTQNVENADADSSQSAVPSNAENSDSDSQQTAISQNAENSDGNSPQNVIPSNVEATGSDSQQTAISQNAENTDGVSQQTAIPSNDENTDGDSQQTAISQNAENTDSDSQQTAISQNAENTNGNSPQSAENAPTDASADAPILQQEENGGGLTAAAYVLCTLPSGGQYGLIPLPAEGEISYPIRQTFVDGTQTENVLHLTPDGFYMESSTCKNQNCVQQGAVTLENRDERVLQNCVICLPNQVMAELYTAEEIAEMNLPALEDAAETPSGE